MESGLVCPAPMRRNRERELLLAQLPPIYIGTRSLFLLQLCIPLVKMSQENHGLLPVLHQPLLDVGSTLNSPGDGRLWIAHGDDKSRHHSDERLLRGGTP